MALAESNKINNLKTNKNRFDVEKFLKFSDLVIYHLNNEHYLKQDPNLSYIENFENVLLEIIYEENNFYIYLNYDGNFIKKYKVTLENIEKKLARIQTILKETL